MIDLKTYLMGRDKEYPISIEQAQNAAKLLARVNWLLGTLRINAKLSSGYRPGTYNVKAGGAQKSTHLMCSGIDLHDPDGMLACKMLDHLHLLEEAGLWLENPKATPKWVHLDIKERKNRVFNP